jgi:protein-tyrosine phosphatase
MQTDKSTNRRLAWGNCYNVRDLGGFPTLDGKTTRYGVVVRSDNVSRLTEEGRTAALEYGIRTVIDVRSPYELDIDPPPFADHRASEGRVQYRNISLIPEGSEVEDLVASAPSDEVMYRHLIDRCGSTMADIMHAIAKSGDGAVLVHCHAGKDRTGLVVALLLALVGVPPKQIVSDYEASNDCLRPYHDEWLSTIDDQGERERQRAASRARPELMRGVLEYVDHEHGGIEAYLLRAGLQVDCLNALRCRLVA